MTETTLTAAELAARVTAGTHTRLKRERAQRFLDEWEARGIVEQPWPGSYRLSPAGAAMFAGFIDDDDLEEAA